MATTNATITKAWTQVAATADDLVLITRSDDVGSVEFALTAADSAPTGIVGHKLMPDEAITREVVGEGYIWMRVGLGSRNDSTSVVVSK
jgi:hypothetical protein